MESQLKDKVAVVTGSSSGLGEAIALLFAARGAKVTLCGRDQDRLMSVLAQAVKVSGGHPERFHTVRGDLNNSKIREELIAQTIQKFGRLDILVANAGVMHIRFSVFDVTEESYNEVMDTNVKSVFFLIQKAIPHLEATKGNIIIMSSVGSIIVHTISIVYCMSKSALDHLTRCLAVDLGSKGIRVNSLNPGVFPSRILRTYKNIDPNRVKEYQAKISPLKGRVGTENDVAEYAAFLASDAAGFITGERLIVDGGAKFMGCQSLRRPQAKY